MFDASNFKINVCRCKPFHLSNKNDKTIRISRSPFDPPTCTTVQLPELHRATGRVVKVTLLVYETSRSRLQRWRRADTQCSYFTRCLKKKIHFRPDSYENKIIHRSLSTRTSEDTEDADEVKEKKLGPRLVYETLALIYTMIEFGGERRDWWSTTSF